MGVREWLFCLIIEYKKKSLVIFNNSLEIPPLFSTFFFNIYIYIHIYRFVPQAHVTGDSRVGFTLTSSLFAKAFAALERESPSLSLSVRDSKLQVWKKKICMLLYIVSKSVASCAPQRVAGAYLCVYLRMYVY